MGLEGETPEGVETSSIKPRVKEMYKSHTLNLNSHHKITFQPDKHLIFHFRESLPQHPNGMRFSAYDKNGDLIATNEYFSIGGGFVVNEKTQLAANVFFKDRRIDHTSKIDPTNEAAHKVANDLADKRLPIQSETSLPDVSQQSSLKERELPSRVDSKFLTAALPFHNAESLLKICERENLTIAKVVFRNELQWRSPDEITGRTLNLWKVMDQSIQNGISSTEEYLPGQLKVRRRAPALHKRLMTGLADYAGFSSSPAGTPVVSNKKKDSTMIISGSNVTPIRPSRKSLPALDWISLYALAVNEENAAGGRVVTVIFISVYISYNIFRHLLMEQQVHSRQF